MFALYSYFITNAIPHECEIELGGNTNSHTNVSPHLSLCFFTMDIFKMDICSFYCYLKPKHGEWPLHTWFYTKIFVHDY